MIFISNKIVLQTVFIFFPDNQTLLVVALFVMSLANYYVYNFTEIFYRSRTANFFQICSTLYFWTNLMLFLSMVLSSTGFTGCLVAYMFGIPLIFFILSYRKKSRINTLLLAQKKFTSGEELQSHLRYVLQLINTQDNDRNSYMMLIGYAETHKENCDEDDCPLKVKKTSKKKRKSISQVFFI